MGAGSNKQGQLLNTENMTEFKVEGYNQVETCWSSTVFYRLGYPCVTVWGYSKFGLKVDDNCVVELPGSV